MSSPRQHLGSHYEQLACTYLCRHGLTLLTRNYHCRFGELDLVMRERDWLVFVEVRYRRSRHYGSALETVAASKQQRLVLAARHYLHRHIRYADLPCRFDVVAIDTGADAIEWVRGAFS